MYDYHQFRELVWEYYRTHGRQFPWREISPDGTVDPYHIVVSEMMLQQTQTARVIPKYQQFLEQFPDIHALANSTLAAVLQVWIGLGYNRRAKFLWEAAQIIRDENQGVIPSDASALTRLPGIGRNTAGAIMAYAYNQPVSFIETNIRTVYIHHFFQGHTDVHDNDILPLVVATVDTEHPREWYWALMDYGVHIKAAIGNVSRDSRHYTRQSQFVGSQRQLRGHVIRQLTGRSYQYDELVGILDDPRAERVISDLLAEQLIKCTGDTLSL